MADTLWPSVVTALLGVVRTAVGHPDTVQVFDGPVITNDDLRSYVMIAADPVGERGAGSWFDTVTTLGLPARHEERGEIIGAVAAQSGDDTPSTVRTTAFTLYESIVDAIEADPTLGMTNLVAGRIESGRVDTGQSRLGVYAEITFTFTYLGVTGT